MSFKVWCIFLAPVPLQRWYSSFTMSFTSLQFLVIKIQIFSSVFHFQRIYLPRPLQNRMRAAFCTLLRSHFCGKDFPLQICTSASYISSLTVDSFLVPCGLGCLSHNTVVIARKINILIIHIFAENNLQTSGQ